MEIATDSAIHDVWKRRTENYKKSNYNNFESVFNINPGDNTLFWKETLYTEGQIKLLQEDSLFNFRYKLS